MNYCLLFPSCNAGLAHMDVFPGDLVFMCAAAEVSTFPIRVIGRCRAAGVFHKLLTCSYFFHIGAAAGRPSLWGFAEQQPRRRGSSRRATSVWRKVTCQRSGWGVRGQGGKDGRLKEHLPMGGVCRWCGLFFGLNVYNTSFWGSDLLRNVAVQT